MNQTVTLESLQQQLAQLTQLVLSQKEVLTVEECAHYAGISKKHIYNLTSKQQIPHYKPHGKTLYFKRKEIDQWLLKNKTASPQEVQTKAANHTLGL